MPTATATARTRDDFLQDCDAEDRSAYESLRDLNTRIRYRLFEAGKNENMEALIEEVACRSQRRRLSLQTLLNTISRT